MDSPKIQHIPAMDARPETGPMQFGDDWPGVFIRGDRAAWYSMLLARAADRLPEGIERAQVMGLATTLRGCVVGPAAVQMARGSQPPLCGAAIAQQAGETYTMGCGRARERADVIDFILHPPGRITEGQRAFLSELVRALRRGDHVGEARHNYEDLPWLGEHVAAMPAEGEPDEPEHVCESCGLAAEPGDYCEGDHCPDADPGQSGAEVKP